METAEMDKKHTIIFVWKEKKALGSCRLHDKTVSEAKEIARGFGWTETKWYKPKTWYNGFLIFN